MGTIQQFLDFLSNKSCFLLVGILTNINCIKRYLGFRKRNMGNSLMEHLGFTVVEATHITGHTRSKHIIDGADDSAGRSEITTEKDFSAISSLCLFRREITVIFFQEDTGIRQAKLINGLLDISNHKTITALMCQCGENRILYLVAVLVFIYHNFPESGADFFNRCCETGAVLAQKKIQHFLLNIAEIQYSPNTFQFAVFEMEFFNKIDQSTCG